MCIRGSTQPSAQTTRPASDVPQPPAAATGITDVERRTIVETIAKGIRRATADLDGTVKQGQASHD